MPKIVPKSIQTYFERLLRQIFRKVFAQFSTDGRLLENFQKNTEIFKFPKTTKIVPKCIQTSFDVFWGKLFEKFLPSFPWKVESSKIFKKNQKVFKISKTFKITKMPKIVAKSIQTCFEPILGQMFRNFFCAVFDGGSRLRKSSKKIQKISKFQKRPKSFPKVSKRVLNKFWGKLFENFLLSFPWKVES